MLLKNGQRLGHALRLRQGEGLSEHRRRFEALLVVTDGEAEVTLDGETHAVGAGEAILLPANVPHAVHAPPTCGCSS